MIKLFIVLLVTYLIVCLIPYKNKTINKVDIHMLERELRALYGVRNK